MLPGVMEPRAHLHLVPPIETPAAGNGGDVGLLLFLLAVNLVPIVGALAGGRWGDGTLGFTTVASIWCLRELARELAARRAGAR